MDGDWSVWPRINCPTLGLKMTSAEYLIFSPLKV